MRVPGAADAGVARVGFVEAQPAAASASTARLKPTSLYGRHWACTTRTGVRGLARPYRAAVVRSGEVSPRNFRDSRPRMTFGVTIQDPPQVAIAPLPAGTLPSTQVDEVPTSLPAASRPSMESCIRSAGFPGCMLYTYPLRTGCEAL